MLDLLISRGVFFFPFSLLCVVCCVVWVDAPVLYDRVCVEVCGIILAYFVGHRNAGGWRVGLVLLADGR